MAEKVFPKCPICDYESLIPLSAVVGDMGSVKTYAHWICPNCGFYIGTKDTKGYNIPQDIFIYHIPQIREYVEKIKERYKSILDK